MAAETLPQKWQQARMRSTQLHLYQYISVFDLKKHLLLFASLWVEFTIHSKNDANEVMQLWL